MSSFVADHGHAGVFVKIVFIVFAAMIDQQVFFFIDKLQNIPLARFEMWRQLNG